MCVYNCGYAITDMRIYLNKDKNIKRVLNAVI